MVIKSLHLKKWKRINRAHEVRICGVQCGNLISKWYLRRRISHEVKSNPRHPLVGDFLGTIGHRKHQVVGEKLKIAFLLNNNLYIWQVTYGRTLRKSEDRRPASVSTEPAARSRTEPADFFQLRHLLVSRTHLHTRIHLRPSWLFGTMLMRNVRDSLFWIIFPLLKC